jgi:predicted transposase/invertase (TIGR01784 family)
MIASCVKRCLRSVAASHAIAPSMAAVSRASFFRGKWQTVPTHFRCFSTSDPLPPWLHLPMEACVRDARFDQTFKILLGEEGAERRAISFLNAVLRLKEDGDRIKQIQFLDRSLYSLDNRAIHFDVRIQGLCSTYAGHTFLVEMQKFRVPSHMNRWIYYGCREITAIGERLHNAPTSQDKGVNQKTFYTGLTPVKVIVIADFDSPLLQTELKNSTDFVVDWNICETKSHDVASPLLSWTFLVLPRFSSALSASGNSLDFTGKTLEAWLYLMTRNDCETVRVTTELVANDEAVAQGFYRVSHLTSSETEIFHKDRMHFDSQSQIRQEDYSEGKKEGLIEGKQEGLVEGKQEGLIEGKQEGLIEGEKKKSMEIARKLHILSGLSAEQISDITGCSSLEIKKSDQN